MSHGWDVKRPAAPVLWDSTIQLGEKFFQEIIAHPVPIDLNILKAIKRSPIGLDLYLWLTYRTFTLKHPLRLSWKQLYRQFGADPAKVGTHSTVKSFRLACLREFKKISRAWPELNYETVTGGLLLSPSPPRGVNVKAALAVAAGHAPQADLVGRLVAQPGIEARHRRGHLADVDASVAAPAPGCATATGPPVPATGPQQQAGGGGVPDELGRHEGGQLTVRAIVVAPGPRQQQQRGRHLEAGDGDERVDGVAYARAAVEAGGRHGLRRGSRLRITHPASPRAAPTHAHGARRAEHVSHDVWGAGTGQIPHGGRRRGTLPAGGQRHDRAQPHDGPLERLARGVRTREAFDGGELRVQGVHAGPTGPLSRSGTGGSPQGRSVSGGQHSR